MPRMTGNRYIAKMLEAYGITSIFQVPTAFFGVMAEMEHMDIRSVVTHGEKAAAYMADGYARASHGPGICNVTSLDSHISLSWSTIPAANDSSKSSNLPLSGRRTSIDIPPV